MYDILILSAKKDFNKIKFLYESLNKHIKNFNKIYCVSDIEVNDYMRISGINYYTDDNVIDFDFSKFKGNVLNRK